MLKFITFFFFVLSFVTAHAQTEIDYIDSYYYTGVLDKKPDYIPSVDAKKNYTPYYVGFEFATDKCTIYHSKSRDKWDKDLVKFAMYHEASHCVLYQEATIYKNNPGIYYLLLADNLIYQQDKKIGYMYFHELYADSLATALLLREKEGKKAIEKMISLRAEAFFGGHQTEKLLIDVSQINWTDKSIAEVKERILKMTEDYFVEAWLDKYFTQDYQEHKLHDITKSLIKSFYGEQNRRLGPEEALFYEFALFGYAEHMQNPKYKLIEAMYQNRHAATEQEYMEKVCLAGPWCD